MLNINIPNALTIFRIVLIPVFVLVFYLPGDSSHIFCAAIFLIAAITDWLDGYLARVLDQGTPFGAFLDPVADKLMVATALVLLVEQQDNSLFTVAAMVIIGREIVVSALREWMAELGKSASVAVSFVGKAKTLAQMAAIFALLLAGPQMPAYVLQVGYVLLYTSAVLTLWSMAVYLSAAINEFEG